MLTLTLTLTLGRAHALRDGVRLVPVQWRLHAVHTGCCSMRDGQEKHGRARREAWKHVHRDVPCAACLRRSEGT